MVLLLMSQAVVAIVAPTRGFYIELSPTIALTPSDPVKVVDNAASKAATARQSITVPSRSVGVVGGVGVVRLH